MTTPVSFDLQKGAIVLGEPARADGLFRLAQAVIVQAARDAAAGDPAAAAWLADDETANTWLALADLDRRAVLAWLAAGCLIGGKHTKRGQNARRAT